MKMSWILVSNSNTAHIFSTPRAKLLNGDEGKILVFIKELEHPKSRLRKHDLVTDRQGNAGATTYAAPNDPVEVERELFAHEITSALEKGRINHEFDDLILVGPSHFLGKINSCMKDHHSLNQLVSVQINKNYVTLDVEQLLSDLKKHL